MVVLNGYLLLNDSIIPCYKRIGSTNTDRRFNSKCCSEWVDWLVLSIHIKLTHKKKLNFGSQRWPVFWPPISRQTIIYFSIIMTIQNPKRSATPRVNSLEMVRFPPSFLTILMSWDFFYSWSYKKDLHRLKETPINVRYVCLLKFCSTDRRLIRQ